jgi:hypothetical protein
MTKAGGEDSSEATEGERGRAEEGGAEEEEEEE